PWTPPLSSYPHTPHNPSSCTPPSPHPKKPSTPLSIVVPPTILSMKPGLPSPLGLPGDSLSPFVCNSLTETLPPQETSLTSFTYSSPSPMDNSRNSGYSSLSSTPLPRSSLDSLGSEVRIPGSTGRASPSTSI
ncbi:hypothetical protein C0992_001928, partial [Termitomyces sp. T32_za158]